MSLRIALVLALVFAVAGVLLLMVDAEVLRARLGHVETVLAAVAAVLVATWLALWPLAREADRGAARADEMSARAGELARELARARQRQQEMLAKVSHDLRTPLASVQGYLELLLLRQGSLDGTESHNYLHTAVRQSARLARLVDDLCEWTELTPELHTLQREPFPIVELAHDVAQRFEGSAQRAGIALQVRADAGAALIVSAELRLVERALGRLLDNALRHTSSGGRVAIEVQRTSAGSARVCVADTGEGIAEAELGDVFERFESAARVGDSGTRPAGLGLAITRRIAALHGSALELHSRPGEGTRVAFELPAATADAAAS